MQRGNVRDASAIKPYAPRPGYSSKNPEIQARLAMPKYYIQHDIVTDVRVEALILVLSVLRDETEIDGHRERG